MTAAPAFISHSPLDSLVRRTSARRAHTPGHFSHTQYPLPSPLPHHQLSPASPLLHGHFARDSIATASSNGDTSEFYPSSTRTSIDSRIVYPALHQHDDESIYSNATGLALRESWQSATTSRTTRDRREYTETLEDIIPDSNPTYYSQHDPYPSFSSNAPVPTVVVSSPNRAGRTPIMGPTGYNFSRPVRPLLSSILQDEQQKRRVVERNMRRAPSPSTTRHTPSSPHTSSSRQVPPISPASNLTLAPHQPTATAPLSLLRRPPSLRMSSPASLYSSYSFYQLDSTSSSPTREELRDDLKVPSPSDQVGQQSPAHVSVPPISSPDTPTPQDYLQQGIQHHEANRLKESAISFEKSAKEDGGCGIGMLMWGLALRHGWGCEKNEKIAFKWLTRAAESAVEDLEYTRAGGGIDSNAVQVCVPVSDRSPTSRRLQTELVLAIYEVGQCFFQGWGVAKDQKMAVVCMSSRLLSG